MAKKLKGAVLAKLGPEQFKKIAAALAQSAKKTKQASKNATAAVKALSAAKAANKSGQKAVKDLEG